MQLQLSKEVYEKLSKLAKELDMPRTQVINMLVNQYNKDNKNV